MSGGGQDDFLERKMVVAGAFISPREPIPCEWDMDRLTPVVFSAQAGRRRGAKWTEAPDNLRKSRHLEPADHVYYLV